MPCSPRPDALRPTCSPRSTRWATATARRSRTASSPCRRAGRRPISAWIAAGWNAVSAPVEWGGQGLPHALNAACIEMWNSASMAFGIGPVLTMGAAEALAAYGSEQLKATYLRKLVSGEWMGTMQLTEPQAGSDCRRVADQGRACRRRQLSHHRQQDLHHLWRARAHRQHHSFRAGAPVGCAARQPWHFAVPGAQVPGERGRLARTSATMCARTRSSTSSASMPRRPAQWSMAIMAAQLAIWSARRTAALPACSR